MRLAGGSAVHRPPPRDQRRSPGMRTGVAGTVRSESSAGAEGCVGATVGRGGGRAGRRGGRCGGGHLFPAGEEATHADHRLLHPAVEQIGGEQAEHRGGDEQPGAVPGVRRHQRDHRRHGEVLHQVERVGAFAHEHQRSPGEHLRRQARGQHGGEQHRHRHRVHADHQLRVTVLGGRPVRQRQVHGDEPDGHGEGRQRAGQRPEQRVPPGVVQDDRQQAAHQDRHVVDRPVGPVLLERDQRDKSGDGQQRHRHPAQKRGADEHEGQQRPHEVELPLDGDRPGVRERLVRRELVDHEQVERHRLAEPRAGAVEVREGVRRGEHHQVDRQDAEDAPDVEGPQRHPSPRLLLAQHQRGDQEAGQHEEQLDADPAGQPGPSRPPEVEGDDDHRGDRAEPVEGREPTHRTVFGVTNRGHPLNSGERCTTRQGGPPSPGRVPRYSKARRWARRVSLGTERR